jgi:hypothetical protein
MDGFLLEAIQMISPQSFTINEWLKLRRYSRPHWYRMPPEDKPDVIGGGKAQRITKKADEEWEARQIAKGRAKREHRQNVAQKGNSQNPI